MTNKNERNFYDTIETARCGVAARDIHFLRYDFFFANVFFQVGDALILTYLIKVR
jgi:hypothetical protein